jgi:hypothetical protein
MNRLGLTPGEARKLPSSATSWRCSSGPPDEPSRRGGHARASLNRKQLAAFRAVRVLLPDIRRRSPTRPGSCSAPTIISIWAAGIALYGGASVEGASPMRPVVTIEARVLQVRDGKPGETVGYGATETIKKASRIAILAAGYADGYHRLAGSTDERYGARAFVHGRHAPLIGRVSMDLIAVDVTGISGVERGDWVELIGPMCRSTKWRRHRGYELLTSLERRYARVYVGRKEEMARAGSVRLPELRRGLYALAGQVRILRRMEHACGRSRRRAARQGRARKSRQPRPRLFLAGALRRNPGRPSARHRHAGIRPRHRRRAGARLGAAARRRSRHRQVAFLSGVAAFSPTATARSFPANSRGAVRCGGALPV